MNKLTARLKVPGKQWIKFATWSALYILWTVWVGNYFLLFGLLLILDIYITKFIPWGAWKQSKNKTVKKIADWVDAILFALVAVYFINIFLFQNYNIPTSSLEKSLLVGDYLFVSKVSYGPRIPNTPLSFPLTQHTFPVINSKSYLEWIKWDYKRLPGLDTIKLNDIVVFNFPTGDTVPTEVNNPDYYTLSRYHGRDEIWNNKTEFGEIVVRPVDKKENYVKRCVALPGDTLQIIDNIIYLNGVREKNIPGIQYNYLVYTDGRPLSDKQFETLQVSKEDQTLINNLRNGAYIIDALGFHTDRSKPANPTYHIPLTQEALEACKKFPNVTNVIIESIFDSGETFPVEYTNWNRDNYGPVWIPRKGTTVDINLSNLPLYERIIRNYEGNDLTVKDSSIYINGAIATTYTFNMNYYFMMGDNRHKSLDSRYWGFVPEDHVVGKPILIWLSLDKDKSFPKNIRWKRLFTMVHKD